MFKITINELANSVPFFNRLSFSKTKLPANLSYRVVALSLELEKEYQKLDDVRKQLAEKYFEKNDDGSYKLNEDKTMYKIIPDKESAYTEELANLLNEQVTIYSEKLPTSILECMDDIDPSSMREVINFFE